LFQIQPFGVGLGCHNERGPGPFVFLGIFAVDEGAADAQAESEGIEAHGCLALGCLGFSSMLRVQRLASCDLSEITISEFLFVWLGRGV